MLQSMLGRVNWRGSTGEVLQPWQNGRAVIKADLVTDRIMVLAGTFDFVLHVHDNRATVSSKMSMSMSQCMFQSQCSFGSCSCDC